MGWKQGSNPALVNDPTYLEPRITAVEVEQTAQLADVTTDKYFIGITAKDRTKPTRGIVTFITDDAYTEDSTYFRPLFNTKGVPFCTAVITSSVGNPSKATKAQLLEIQADGHEIMSHSKTHQHTRDIVSDVDAEAEFSDSLNWFNTNGFNVESFTYPYGSLGEREKRFAKKYYRSARASESGLFGQNKPPLSTFELNSIWLDSNVTGLIAPNGSGVNTLEYYQYYIDKTVVENGWLIISFHSWEALSRTQLFIDVLDYAKAKCDILTHSQALDKVGNIIEVGSFGKTTPHINHFAVGYDGTTNRNELPQVIKLINQYDGNSAIDDFEDYKVTVNTVNTTVATSSGLPESIGGVLYTYKHTSRLGDNVYNYQIYNTILNNTVYKRMCNTNKTFGAWEQISASSLISLKATNAFTCASLLSSFPRGLTITPINGSTASTTGSPELAAGVLVTCRVSATSIVGYNWQEYHIYGTSKIYKRSFDDSGVAKPWSLISSQTLMSDTTNTYTSSTAISAFAIGVTYGRVDAGTATSTGSPESLAGVLITYKTHASVNGYNWQEYHIYGTAKVYKRSFADNGTPTVWTKISAV